MKRLRPNNSRLAKAAVSLTVALFVCCTTLRAAAQENTSNSASTPLVYSVENSGANYAAPVFPSFEQLPIVRPLPDPFRTAPRYSMSRRKCATLPTPNLGAW